MRKRLSRAAALFLTLGLLGMGLWGCAGSQSAPAATAAPAAQTETAAAPEQTETTQAEAAAAVEKEETSSADTSKVAGAGDMAAVEEVVEEGMVPVASSGLVPGTYKVKADSSSSMFRITDCELTVPEGEAVMQAFLTLSGSSYLYLFPGTAEEAAAADASKYIEAGENAEGKNTFLFPVEALDFGVPCAAFSKNKEMWYDRTLVFRADSLPLSAFREGEVLTPSGLDLDDGEYTAEVVLSGGSGRASVQSPARLTLKNSRSAEAEVTAELVWSSANYDYMVVEGEKYLPEIADGHSVFRIPVTCFDRNMAVIADTTAMSQAHDERISSPILSKYDIAIVLNQPSLDKFQPKVKPGGILIYDSYGIINPPTRKDIKVYSISAMDKAAEMKNSKIFNMIVLGGMLSVCPVVTNEGLEKALYKTLPERHHGLIPLNMEAVKAGGEIMELK